MQELEDSKHIELEINSQSQQNDEQSKILSIVKLFTSCNNAASLTLTYNQQVQKDAFDQWIQLYESNSSLQNFTINISNSNFPIQLNCSKSLKVQLNSFSILLSPKEVKIQINRDLKIQQSFQGLDLKNCKLDINLQRVVSVGTIEILLRQLDSCQNLQINQIGFFNFYQNALELSNFDSGLIKILQKYLQIEDLTIKNLNKIDQETEKNLIGLIQQQSRIKVVKINCNKLKLESLKGLISHLEQQQIEFSFDLLEGSVRVNFETQQLFIKMHSQEIWESFLLPLANRIENQIEIITKELKVDTLISFLEQQKNNKAINIKFSNQQIIIGNSQIHFNILDANEGHIDFLLKKIKDQQNISIQIGRLNDVIYFFNKFSQLNLQNTKHFSLKLFSKDCRFETLSFFQVLTQKPNIEHIYVNVDTNIFSLENQDDLDKQKKAYFHMPSIPLLEEEVNIICDIIIQQDNSNVEIESISNHLSQSNKAISQKYYLTICEILKNRQQLSQVTINNYSFYRQNRTIQINNLDKLDLLINLNFQNVEKIEIANINLKETSFLWNKTIQNLLKQAENSLQSLTMNFGMNMKKYQIDFQYILQLPQIQFITIAYQGDQGLILDIPKRNLEINNCGITNLKIALTKCQISSLSYLISHKDNLSSEEVDIIKSLKLQSLLIERLSAPFHEKFTHQVYQELEVQFLELIKYCFDNVECCNIKYANNLIIFDKNIDLTRVEIDSEAILSMLASFQHTKHFKFKIKNFLNEDLFNKLLSILKSQAFSNCQKIYLTLKTTPSQSIQLVEYLDSLNFQTDLTISSISQILTKDEASNLGQALSKSKNILKFQISVPNLNAAQIIEIIGDKQKLLLNANTPQYFNNQVDMNHFLLDFICQFELCNTLKFPLLLQPQINNPNNSAQILHDIMLLLSNKLLLLKTVQLYPDYQYLSKQQNNSMGLILYQHMLLRRQTSYLIKQLQKLNYIGLNRPEKLFDLTEFIYTQPQNTNQRLN